MLLHIIRNPSNLALVFSDTKKSPVVLKPQHCSTEHECKVAGKLDEALIIGLGKYLLALKSHSYHAQSFLMGILN